MGPELKLVGHRKAARDAAFKVVYAMTVGGLELDPAMDSDVLGGEFTPDAAAYIRAVAGGVMANPTIWDEKYSPCLTANWPLERLALTDKIALRMACYELWKLDDTPPKVTLCEYVDIAKRYGTKESGKFVNGVLATVLKSSPKAEWEPPILVDPEPVAPATPEPASPKKREKASWTIKSED